MSKLDRTESLRLTREENAGWFTAMQEMKDWHKAQLAISMNPIEAEAHHDAIQEIERLMLLQKYHKA